MAAIALPAFDVSEPPSPSGSEAFEWIDTGDSYEPYQPSEHADAEQQVPTPEVQIHHNRRSGGLRYIALSVVVLVPAMFMALRMPSRVVLGHIFWLRRKRWGVGVG